MSERHDLGVESQARYAFVADLLRRDVPPPADILELGAAPGDQIAALAREGYRATSLDLGEAPDEWGSGEGGRMARLYAENGVRDVRWDLEQVPYPLQDASFDAIIMTEVYEHLSGYPIRSLQEIHRLLRPSGRLYFTTPNAAYLLNRIRLVAGRSVATPLPDWIAGLPHARHFREYTFGEVRELMAYADLEVVETCSRHFHLDIGRTTPVARAGKRALAWLAEKRETLGPEIVVVARRR